MGTKGSVRLKWPVFKQQTNEKNENYMLRYFDPRKVDWPKFTCERACMENIQQPYTMPPLRSWSTNLLEHKSKQGVNFSI